MSKIDTLFVFSIPRAGTNHMFYFMQNIKRLDVRFEIYHPIETYSISAHEVDLLSGLAGCKFKTNKDKDLIRWIHKNPIPFLKFISERASLNSDFLIFKIFPNHINKKQIEKLLKSRQTTKAIIIKRCPVDSFISLIKSVHTGKYLNLDTSKIVVELDSNYFKEWWVKNYNWYRAIESLLIELGVPYTHLSYEHDIYCSDLELKTNITHVFSRFGLTIEFKSDMKNRGLRKQDLELKYANKVSNWNHFLSELEAYNLADNAFRAF